MTFDAKAFVAEKFEPRTAKVRLPALRQWHPELPDGQDPAWTVRGLTSTELAQAEEQATKGRDGTAAVLEALRKANRIEGIDELERSLGLDDKVPLRLALKLEHITRATVDPPLSLQTAVKLASTFPIEFELLHRKITELTGLGQVAVKKLESSGEIPEYARAS